MMMRFSAVVALALGLLGCAIDTVPLPEDIPSNHEPDPSGASAINPAAIYYAPLAGRLGGVAGAVPPSGWVRVFAQGALQGQAQATARGSFYLVLNLASDVTSVVLAVGDAETTGATLIYALPLASADAQVANASAQDFAAEDDFTRPDAPSAGVFVSAVSNGVWVVAGAGTLQPGISVVVMNPRLGETWLVAALPDGSFGVLVGGQAGDTLELFAVEPAVSNGGGQVFSVLVE